jgi:hypothetical protein
MVGDWIGSDGAGWDDSESSLRSEPLCVCAWETMGRNANATRSQDKSKDEGGRMKDEAPLPGAERELTG